MKSILRWSLLSLACLSLPAVPASAKAMMIAPPALPVRVAQAGTIVSGKVEKIEEKTVRAPRFPGDKEKGEYQIAVIKIEDAILNAKGLTHVRVGFLAPPPPPMPQPMGAPMILIKRRPTVSFTQDQEVLVFLTPLPDANFLTAPNYFDVINKQGNQNFDKDVAEVKKLAKLLDNPKDGLKSEKPEERFTTAALLISNYRHQRLGAAQKTEAVDADTSKLVLSALAEADWKNGQPALFRLTPQQLFGQLGLTEKDGWKQPANFNDYAPLAQKWLKENAGTYRLQRFVAEKADK